MLSTCHPLKSGLGRRERRSARAEAKPAPPSAPVSDFRSDPKGTSYLFAKFYFVIVPSRLTHLRRLLIRTFSLHRSPGDPTLDSGWATQYGVRKTICKQSYTTVKKWSEIRRATRYVQCWYSQEISQSLRESDVDVFKILATPG